VNSGLTAIVPVRGLDGGKTRLAGYLLPGERSALIRLLAHRVLHAALTAGVADRVVLLTGDATYADAAQRDLPGIEILLQPGSVTGLNAGLEYARSMRPSAVHLVLFADLPRIRAEDVRGLVAGKADVTIARDRHGTGTNALVLRGQRAGRFRFSFGAGSHARHVDEAQNQGLTVENNDTPNLRFDLDSVEDWFELPDVDRHDLAARIGMTGARAGQDSQGNPGVEGERDTR